MKVALFVVSCLFSLCFAQRGNVVQQINGAGAWNGEWNSNKRSFGGSTFICVDLVTNMAYGQYSGAGVFQGTINGNVMVGEWYEAGYDSPFGTFELTISGDSFSGTWSYFAGDNQASSPVQWTGSRISSNMPTNVQCLKPAAAGTSASGVFENVHYFCVDDSLSFQNTGQQAVYATVQNFATVGGLTPDCGSRVCMSDFPFQDGENMDSFRPENNPTPFGPCNGCIQNLGDPEFILTRKVVIGAMVNDRDFCGFFWEGFYNQLVNPTFEPLCLVRTSTAEPPASICGAARAVLTAPDYRQNTELLLSEIQRVLNQLPGALPRVSIRLNNPAVIDDDDEDFPPGYFDKFLTEGDLPPPVEFPTLPSFIPVPVPVPTLVFPPDDDEDEDGGTVIIIYYDDDNQDDDDDDGVIIYDDDDDVVFPSVVPSLIPGSPTPSFIDPTTGGFTFDFSDSDSSATSVVVSVFVVLAVLFNL